MQLPAPLQNRWAHPRVRSLPPVHPAAVVDAFAKAGLTASRDLVSLYSQIGGMDVGDSDDWRLWSPGEVLDEYALAHGGPIAFSDYMIDCWRFYLLPNDEDTCRVLSDYGEGPLREISPSLESFLGALATDFPRRILDPASLSGRPPVPNGGRGGAFGRATFAVLRKLLGRR